MSTQTQSVTQHALSRILELIREIVEKSTNGNCIYRGEPEHYDKVSSAHYRFDPDGFDSGKFNLDILQKEILRNARNHIHDHEKEDFELLTELQHYGSQTSLIDFTTDLHIALFFACNGSHDKNGRIIVLPRTEDIDNRYRVKRPSKPLNRVLTQKSIFTLPHKGYIDHNDFIRVNVPANLKQWILIYLRKFQDISTQSIYNDLHGFIRDHNIRYSREARLPLAWAEFQLKYIADNNPPAEEQQTTYRKVIEDYTKTLQYSPYDVELYVKQSIYYLYLNELNCTIEACSKAILLQSNYSDAYVYRGFAFFCKKDYVDTIEDLDYVIQKNPHNAKARIIRGIAALHLQDWEKAKLDFEVAKEMGEDITSLFCQDSQSISDFEQKYNVKLPKDIAAMLTIP